MNEFLNNQNLYLQDRFSFEFFTFVQRAPLENLVLV